MRVSLLRWFGEEDQDELKLEDLQDQNFGNLQEERVAVREDKNVSFVK
jgi:hypothetical protein